MTFSKIQRAWLSGVAFVLWASCSSSPAGMGGARQACFTNGTCNQGLICLSDVCVAPADGGAGTMGTGGNGGVTGTGGNGGVTGTSGNGGVTGTAGAAAGTSGADAAAGTSGVDAAAGTSGTDAAAGTSGTDAAAGTSGTDAAAGTSGADAAAGASSNDAAAGASGHDAGSDAVVNCGLDSTWGPFTFTADTESASESMPEVGNSTIDAVNWSGYLGDSANPDIADVLTFSLFATIPPFGATITTMSNIDLSQQSSSGCGACVVMVLNANLLNPSNLTLLQLGPTYLATSGTLDLTQVPPFPTTATSRLSGTMANVVFEHVNIDPQTNAAAAAGDGCKFTLSSAAFDSPVPNN